MPKNFWLCLIVVAAIGLRLIAINQSLWLDEAISVQTALNYSPIEIINQFAPKDFNPPLHYLILHFWLKIFPSIEFFIRLPSIIFALLTLIFVYKISLVTFKEIKTSILAMAILATSPLHIYYSQEARMYSLATLLATISFYWLLKLLKEPKWHNIFLYVITSILMVYTHYLTWLVVISQGLYILFVKRRLITIYIWIILSYILWLPIFLQQLAIGQRTTEVNDIWSEISGRFTLKATGLIPVKFIIGRTSFDNKFIYGAVVLGMILLFVILVFKAWQVKISKVENIIWLWLILPIIFGILISIKLPVLSYFRFIFCLPALYLLIARGITSLKKLSIFFIIFVIGINVFFSLRYLFIPQFHRENWQQAVRDLKTFNTTHRSVLIYGNVRAPLDYYFSRFEVSSPVVRVEDKELITNENVVWFIPYAQPIFDQEDLTRKFLRSKGFSRTFEQHFNGVTLEKWEKMLAFRYN